MRLLETEIKIDASPQTVWSILDDLPRYPEWNRLVPEISGRTTVDGSLRLLLVQPNTPNIPLEPKIIRVVAARELRWISSFPDPSEFSGEHIFVLKPTEDGGCLGLCPDCIANALSLGRKGLRHLSRAESRDMAGLCCLRLGRDAGLERAVATRRPRH